jgi:hypothetical protein
MSLPSGSGVCVTSVMSWASRSAELDAEHHHHRRRQITRPAGVDANRDAMPTGCEPADITLVRRRLRTLEQDDLLRSAAIDRDVDVH